MNNSTKTNATFNKHDLLVYVELKCVGSSLRSFGTDKQPYVGIGSKQRGKNVFSLNYHAKTGINIYCTDEVFALFETMKTDKFTTIKNGNSSSKSIPHTIVLNDFSIANTLFDMVFEYLTTGKITTQLEKVVFTDVVKYNVDANGYGLPN